jgi:hypothetical protein
MTPSLEAELLGAVRELRLDMGRRFGRVDKRLDAVCGEVATIKQQRDTATAVAAALAEAASTRTLSNRWRATFAIAAGGGLIAAAAQLVPFVRWLLVGLP